MMETKTKNLEEYLSIERVSQLLEVSKGTIYNLIRKGQLKKTKITSDITRLKASDVQAFLDAQTV